MLRRLPLFLTLLLPIALFGQDFVKRGEDLLLQNKPVDAATYLEAAVAQGQGGDKAYLYLGLAYEAQGKRADARRVLLKGLDHPGDQAYLIYYNLGNLNFADGLFDDAEKAYTASLELRPAYESSLLNRANTRLKKNDLRGAEDDYKRLLVLNPNHPQEPEIRRLLALLGPAITKADEDKALAEAQRLAEAARQAREAEAKALADAAAKAEADRLAAEDAARREALLAKIRESLTTSATDTGTLRAGDAGVQTVETDVPLAD